MKKFYLLGGMAVATALFAAASTFPFASPEQMEGGGKSPVNQQVTDAYADPATQADGAGLPTPYSANTCASSSALSSGWSVIDANNDGRTWAAGNETHTSKPTGITATASSNYTYSGKGNMDDYLLSPAIHFEAGKEYKVIFNWRAGNKNESETMTVYLSQSVQPEEIKASTEIVSYVNFVGANEGVDANYQKVSKTITPEQTGDYHVVFYCNSIEYQTGVKVYDLIVAEDTFAPAGVSALTATPGANHALSCELSWTLPTTDVFGEAIPADKTITAVKVYRDGVEIEDANLDGTATLFTDNEATGLTSGKHVYAVSVVVDGVEGARTEVGPTNYIGPAVAQDVPCQFSIENADEFDFWKTFHSSDATSTNQWEFDSSKKSASYKAISNAQFDDWLFTPAFKVTEPGYYRVTFGAFMYSSDYKTNLDLYLTSSTDVDDKADFNQIASAWQLKSAYSWNSSLYKFFDFYIETPGEYHVAIHNNLPPTSPNSATYHILYAKFDTSYSIPGVVSNLKAIPDADYKQEISVSWENPITDNAGQPMAADAFKVEIYLNNETTPVKTITDNSTSTVISVPDNGIYTVTVKTVSTDGKNITAVEAPSVTTTWVGDTSVAIPYTTDFKPDDVSNNFWSIVDGNKEESDVTFVLNAPSNYTHEMKLSNSARVFNDFILSPDMNLKPGAYKISVKHCGNATEANPYVGLVKKGEFNTDMENKAIKPVQFSVKSYSNTIDEAIFEVTEEGTYQAFYGLQQEFQLIYNSLKLDQFSIEKSVIYPGNVEDLAFTAQEGDTNTITLTWKNPTTAYKAADIELSSIESIVITRDGKEIATITENVTPGKEMTFEDTDVPNGEHVYVVYATADGNGHDGEYASVETPWIGGSLTVPVDHVGKFPGWKSHDANSDKTDSGMYYWAPKSSYFEIEGSGRNHDDYLMTAPIKIEKNVIYKVNYGYSGGVSSSDNPNAMELHIKIGKADETDHTQYSELTSYALPAAPGTTTRNCEFYVAVGPKNEQQANIALLGDDDETPEDLYNKAAKVDEGDSRFAVHVNQPGTVRVKEFHIAKVADFTPTTEIVEIGVGKVTFDGQAVNFAGEAAVQVYNIAGVCVAADDAAEGYFNVAKLGAGYYIVKVTSDAQTITMKVTVK